MKMFFSKKHGMVVLLVALFFPFFMEFPASGASLQAIQERGTLKVGFFFHKNYENALAFHDEKGTPQGFEVDLVHHIAQAAGVSLDIVSLPWKDGVTLSWDPDFHWDLFDIAISTISITPERATVCDFSIPYFSTGQVVVVRGNLGIIVMEQLQNHKIGTALNTTSEEVTKNIFGENSVVFYPDVAQCITALYAGNVDAIVADFAVIAENPLVKDGTFFVLPKSLSREDYGVALEKGNKALKDLINKVITQYKEKSFHKEVHW